MRKRILAVVLTTVVASSLLAGCNKTKPTTDNTSKEDLTVEEFTLFSPDVMSAYENFESPVAKKISEKTGVKLKIEFPVGDYKQKIALMTASQQYPDLILHKENTMTTLVQAKALVKLDSMIDKHGPNIKEFWGDLYGRLKYSKEDPSIYAFGSGQTINDPIPGEYWNIAFAAQMGALKEQGYPQVKTLKDYENVLKTYLKAHPTTDGKPTIGLSLITADGWRHLISLTNPAYYVTGVPDNGEWYIDEKNNTAMLHHRRPEEKEYFRWLNRMNAEGVLDKESFTQSYADYKAKVASGRVVGLIDGKWQYMEGENKLKQDGKEDKMYMKFPVLQDSSMKWAAVTSDGGASNGGLSITTACKKPEKIVKFMNYLASEEGQILREWGIQGENYDIKDGKRVRQADDIEQDTKDGTAYCKSTGVKVYRLGGWLVKGYGAKDKSGQLISSANSDVEIAAFTPVQKETLAAYKVKAFTDMFPTSKDFPVRKYGSASQLQPGTTEETKVAWQKANEYILKDIAKAILESPDKFDANWDAFQKHLKDAGIEKVEAEITKQLRDRLDLWK